MHEATTLSLPAEADLRYVEHLCTGEQKLFNHIPTKKFQVIISIFMKLCSINLFFLEF